ncbi:MAG: EamA family transporter [Geminicoccaceae bacterium]|nr:EamA family transporter [Geminicoccaceae bacterium]
MSAAPLRGNLIAAASILLWATSFPATDRLLASWSALPLAAARLLVAGLAVGLLALALGEARAWRRGHLGPALLLGGLGLGGSVALMILGQASTGGLAAAVLIASMPVVAALLELPRRGRPGVFVLVGVALAVAGGALLAWRPETGGLELRGGEPLVLASVVVWCWYSRAVAGRLEGLPPTSQSAFTLTAGGAAILAATLLVEAGGLAPARLAFGGEELLLLLWVGAVAVGLSLPLWLVAVRDLGLVPSAIHQNLGPFYVVALGLVLGQGLAPAQAAAAALVVAGALLAQLAPAR